MKKVMILSGAGLSAPSGLKTFRDNGGLWEEYDVMEVCSASGFRKNPQKVLDFYDLRRASLAKVKPNYAHFALAKLKAKFPHNIFMLTQNVDDLLERAKCEGVIHLHGFLPELRCLQCEMIFNIGYESIKNKLCPSCQSANLRHNIVMFEEQAPEYQRLYELLEQTHLFVAIGTSGAVLPVGHYAKMCERSILNLLESDEGLEACFTKVYKEDIVSAVDKIILDVEEFLDV
ncbi:NAD-dependent deacetylase [Campylobacter upsaliensis]|uniref:SIR2 family NAD-dependent protein deacylase n=1 Tax=Campylobacter upsaliensis TaxID=28080 RepID=UPI000E1723CE|nr:NAD-dependent deacetylase [Campylobacter upsaliensis]EAH8308958.1 NAD-dependent deacetylase [Campylobacter upsaliensis]EAH8538866.1 NAD-dependent deacetylase [Campylobacter upsaliensis]EAI2136692.1 NAD-dependent deacetylase [Campylobacter upsaliensis]EAI4357137.1 NAD-dependent deacetylase [Campylobacter upsaliensis]EAI7128506.1 NAD-dependent deacetylase [Campylobacter upsaliensis]